MRMDEDKDKLLSTPVSHVSYLSGFHAMKNKNRPAGLAFRPSESRMLGKLRLAQAPDGLPLSISM